MSAASPAKFMRRPHSATVSGRPTVTRLDNVTSHASESVSAFSSASAARNSALSEMASCSARRVVSAMSAYPIVTTFCSGV